MTDDTKAKSSTERQREFRERQREAGFKQQTLWIHQEAEEEGRRAAADGKPCAPMATRQPRSWALGWVDEMERMDPELVEELHRGNRP